MLKRLLPFLLVLTLLSPLAACTTPAPFGCGELEGRAGEGTAVTLFILVQPSATDDTIAEQVKTDVERFVSSAAERAEALQVTAYVYGGIEDGVSAGTRILAPVACLAGERISLKYNNKDRAEIARESLGKAAGVRVQEAVRNLKLKERADTLPLLTKVANQEGQVLLWSQFTSQGETCLGVLPGTPPDAASAKRLVDACDRQGRIPNLSKVTSVTVKGLGTLTSSWARNMEPFSAAMAKRLCEVAVGEAAKCTFD